MKNIKQLSEIDFNGDEVVFEGTVSEILYAADVATKKPSRVTIRIEDSDEVINGISWSINVNNLIDQTINTKDVIRFTGVAQVFTSGNYQDRQIRLTDASLTGSESIRKNVKVFQDSSSVRDEIKDLIEEFIKTPLLKELLEELILHNSRFFEWPAATKIHHAYPGGLAAHSLSVANISLSMLHHYGGENIDTETLLAGALLHDIGKIFEYNQDGSRGAIGALSSHLYLGAEYVHDWLLKRGVDDNSIFPYFGIKHIILSHHNKLEYGAITTPKTLEAIIVARADEMDATIESVSDSLRNTPAGEFTDRQVVLDGAKAFKTK